uniref:Transposon Ty3-I Gag-Pol polyprotein n=1 Tax=Cajanus cajan TaxID=3821 RepID=A0A151R1H7_CAJCA|nr:Transposon Ty3-I Gag-Pol polyprotein [Cajanus cajan]
MKFPGHDGKIISVRANSKAAQQCYAESLKVAPLDEQYKHNLTSAALADHREITDLDPRSDAQDEHPSPVDELEDLQLGKLPGQTTKISKRLTRELRQQLEAEILRNADLFAWSSADMPGISADLICHKLAIHKEAKPVAQRKRKVGGERREAIVAETQKLLNAGFIHEVRYTTWLANVVLVKKNSGKWRMCVDYTDLNKACPKDSYPLPSIDRLRLMDKVFHQQIGRNMEVYVDDMVVKTTSAVDNATDLAEVFAQLRKHNMRLNPEKCVFGVQGGKFLGFMITSRGIEANPEKCKAIIQMQSPQTVKEVQHLAGCIAQEFEEFLNEFGIKHLSTSVEHPQTNGQAEAANKVILKELKKRLGSAKGQWPEELPSILWAYHCTPQSTTQETPYRLTYGTDAMIPIEVGQISHRRQTFNDEQNAQELAADLDLVDELREEAQIHEEACKLRASRRYNTRVRPRAFRAGDLVWRLLGEARKDTSYGKLAPTWGGPFRVTEDLKNGAYRLEELNGKPIPRTWNATHLKVYYS